MVQDPFGDLRDLYQEVILDHGKHPRNHRHPPEANREARGDNPLCGDRITVYVTISDAGIIEDVAFEGRGCAISTASASLMTEVIRGKTEAEAQSLFESFHELCTEGEDASGAHHAVDEDAMDRLRVLAGVREFPVRVKCATLAWHTLNAAIAGAGRVSTE